MEQATLKINRRPEWLSKKVSLRSIQALHPLLKKLKLNTVCSEAMCPNIGECSSHRVATILILGNRCTRSCAFCSVRKGSPLPVDNGEPGRVCEGIEAMGLRHAVITSVTRDDLTDGGASVFSETVRLIRERLPAVTVELLVPDFFGNRDSVKVVVDAGPDIFAHNIEMVRRLYPLVRRISDYDRSLDVLRMAKEIKGDLTTKSGLMLGLGETEPEVIEAMRDLRKVSCDLLSIGQYLAPSRNHYPVAEYIKPEQFAEYKRIGLGLGFKFIESAPYVRSSYMAEKYIKSLLRLENVR